MLGVGERRAGRGKSRGRGREGRDWEGGGGGEVGDKDARSVRFGGTWGAAEVLQPGAGPALFGDTR